MIYYVIPARRNSIGVPFKNRTLLPYTINNIPLNSNVIVSTDDEFIINKVKNTNTDIIKRSDELSKGNISIKQVMIDVINKKSLQPEDIIVLLYLVYPTRVKDDILKIISFYEQHNAKSLLCCYKTEVHPFLSFYAQDNYKGKPIVNHMKYRRQDYPECFNLSHFVCIFNIGEIDNLKEDLYNKDTVFYPIDKPIDIDTKKDLEQFEEFEELS